MLRHENARILKTLRLAFPFLAALLACTNPGEPPAEGNPDFALYLPPDTTTKIMDWFGMDLDSIEISETPWLSEDDLHLYDYSSHMMYLKGSREDFFDYAPIDPARIGPPFRTSLWCDRPFMVIASGVRAYAGRINCSYWTGAGVVLPEIGEYPLRPRNVMSIDWSWLFASEWNQRPDEQVRLALIDAGIYHAGLSVELQSATVLDSDELSNLEYTFTLTNNGVDALYVPDPLLMGDSLYHFHTNGLVFRNQETGEYYRRVMTGIGGDFLAWSRDWYVLLPSGATLTRTTTVSRMQVLPEGDYWCLITYSAPETVPASEVIGADGRYWMGGMFSEVVGVSVGSDAGIAMSLNKVE